MKRINTVELDTDIQPNLSKQLPLETFSKDNQRPELNKPKDTIFCRAVRCTYTINFPNNPLNVLTLTPSPVKDFFFSTQKNLWHVTFWFFFHKVETFEHRREVSLIIIYIIWFRIILSHEYYVHCSVSQSVCCGIFWCVYKIFK